MNKAAIGSVIVVVLACIAAASPQTNGVSAALPVFGAGGDPGAAFLIAVSTVGLTNQVSLHHIGPLPEKVEGQRHTLQIDLRIAGTLGQISGFLRDVTSNSTVVVEDVQLHEQAGQLSGSVRLRTVFLRE